MEAECRFRSMGTDVHVVVTGAAGAGLLDLAQARIEALDRRWTRFSDDSETSRLNASAGAPVVVPSDTFGLISLAVAGWQETDGAFDPTVLPALVAAGYDRSFELVQGGLRTAPADAAPGCEGIMLAAEVCAITLPRGHSLDLGGVGKGYAADLVADHLLAAGAAGACVNIGGDLKAVGAAPADGWVVAVAPDGAGESARLVLPSGAGLATSTTTRRRWATADGESHHLMDPATGRAAQSDIVSATVIAGCAAWAEIIATALVVRGTAAVDPLLARTGTAALIGQAGGGIVACNGFDDYLV